MQICIYWFISMGLKVKIQLLTKQIIFMEQKSRFMKEGIIKNLENTLFIGGVVLTNRQETPEENREKLRQEELKKNPNGALRDGFNGAENGNLQI